MNKDKLTHYEELSSVIAYPQKGFYEKCLEVQNMLDKDFPEAGDIMRQFTDYVSANTLVDIQELHTR